MTHPPVTATHEPARRLDAFQKQLSSSLAIWSALSVVAGLILGRAPGRFWRGVGAQAVAWGAIDGIIAWQGLRGARRRAAQDPAQREPEREATGLRRLLWLNTGLDVLYVIGGWLWERDSAKRGAKARWRGHGVGVIVQGLFLFAFDLIQARRVPDANMDKSLA